MNSRWVNHRHPMICRKLDNPDAIRRQKGTRVCNERLNAHTFCFLKGILEIVGTLCTNEIELQSQSFGVGLALLEAFVSSQTCHWGVRAGSREKPYPRDLGNHIL